MLIQYASDLHIEFLGKNFKRILKVAGDILILAGDISACGTKEDLLNFIDFMQYICPKYKYVIHVAGNHEYYATGIRNIGKINTIEGINAVLKKLMKIINNYIYLDCDAVNLTINKKSYTFIGATLWSHIEQKDRKIVQDSMNDYKYIYTYKNGGPVRYTTQDMHRLHRKHLNFIAKAIKAAKNRTCILITHHKPISDTPEKDKDYLTCAYETDITKYITSNVKVAIHGHTHKHYNRVVNGTRYLSNPSGYPSQRTGFKNDMTIKV